MSRGSCLVIASLVIGCQSHVQLTAPPPTAPLQDRLQAHSRLQALSYSQTRFVTQYGTEVGRQTDYLQLADGTRVYYPEDILAVVPENSPTSRAVDESESNRSTAQILTLSGLGTIVVGGALVLSPIFTHDPGTDLNMTPIYLGAGLMITGGILALVAGGFARSASDAKATAFETYPASLRERLRLCERGQELVDCP